MMHNVNFNLVNQNGANGGAQPSQVNGHHNPNHSIDIGQLPMRLVSQKAGHRKGTNQNQRGHQNQSLINGMMQIGGGGHVMPGQKNAWQSIDASAHASDLGSATGPGKQGQGLMI